MRRLFNGFVDRKWPGMIPSEAENATANSKRDKKTSYNNFESDIKRNRSIQWRLQQNEQQTWNGAVKAKTMHGLVSP